MRCLELYSGIGGFAVAASSIRWEIAAAFDIDQRAAEVYRLNFQHVHHVRTIESIRASELAELEADLWWLSPPCQPFTRRGAQRDHADTRSASFLHVLEMIRELRPRMLAIENVPEFVASKTADLVRETLESTGYRWKEFDLCPSAFGLPNRRRRFYLAASQHGEPGRPKISVVARQLSEFVDDQPRSDLFEDDVIAEYANAIDVVRQSDPRAMSTVQAGSYLQVGNRIRRFSPREILNLLGFPGTFRMTSGLTNRQNWKLIGNSLSIPVVQYVLRTFGEDIRA